MTQDPEEEPVEIQLTTLWQYDRGELVTFRAKVVAVEGDRLKVADGTDDAFVDVGELKTRFFAVGDTVEVVGRKWGADGDPHVKAVTCRRDWPLFGDN